MAVYCKSDSPGIREKDDPPLPSFLSSFSLSLFPCAEGRQQGGRPTVEEAGRRKTSRASSGFGPPSPN